MKSITITLDEEVVQWVRIEAAKRESSVSRLVREMLREQMRSADAYELARRQFLAVQPACSARATANSPPVKSSLTVL